MKICPGEVVQLPSIDFFALGTGTVFRGTLKAKATESTFIKCVWGSSDHSYVLDLVSGVMWQSAIIVLEVYPDACLKLKG